MMLRGAKAAFCAAMMVWCAVLPGGLVAQEASGAMAADDITALATVLRMPEVVLVMREEGADYGVELADEMFPGQGGADWQDAVAAIYDPDAMLKRFEDRLRDELRGAEPAVAEAIVFFESPAGQRILKLEIEARRALADDAAEEAAKIKVEDMIAADDPRMSKLRDFAETNDLIELNIAGALNANLAFYQGLSDGGAFGGEMTEEQMLTDVWAQEAAVRTQTEEWMFSFLALAYAPLSDADMQAYQAYSETPGAQRVNLALFAAYDAVFTPISRDLGRAAAGQMQGQDI